MSLLKNSLIEESTEETLINVQTILAFIQDLHANLALSGAHSTPTLHHGLSLVLKCAEEAITYELNRLEDLGTMEDKTAIFKA